MQQLASAPPSVPVPTGPRHNLAISIQDRRNHWEHHFFLPNQPTAIKPKLGCPEPAMVLGYDLDGEMLFQLLFGSDPATAGHLLALAFGTDRPADPTYAPLRVRLVTDDSRLHVLPWGNIAYQGRPLAQAGWTVEFHAKCEPGFPEYSRHICYFPGRVVLAASAESHQAAHFNDLRRFFQRHWPSNPDPTLAAEANALRAALQAGSTRLVYYYGPASRHGLLLQDRADGECVPWPDFANWLKQSQSVSLLFLNLVGETGYEALALESEIADDLAVMVKGLIKKEYNRKPNFHFGKLDRLAAVLDEDLRNYFRNDTICGCDDRYREEFPDLLLGGREEMPFDEAVATIRRGEPDNWGNLFDELTDMTNANPPAWPPPHYDPTFWSTRDGR